VRSLLKASISFGLVTIPVRLYAATEEKDLHFRSLHAPCHTPIRYRKWCPHCDREVGAEEIVRGYEFEPGQFVVMGEEDFQDLPTAMARTVEILDFVSLAEIDPIYYEKTYFLEPGEGGARAYALLRRALQETGRIGIARVALRGKSSLAAVRVYGDRCLALETMHFPDEVRNPAGLSLPPDTGYREQELEMARMLIGTLTTAFAPEKYQDEYREALLERIQQKIAGAEAVRPEAPAPTARVMDLMEALRQSIERSQAARGEGASGDVPATGADGARPPAPAPGGAGVDRGGEVGRGPVPRPGGGGPGPALEPPGPGTDGAVPGTPGPGWAAPGPASPPGWGAGGPPG